MLPRSPFAVGTFACESLETRRLLSGYSLTALSDLDSTTGGKVQSTLVRDSQGNLFGTTPSGGINAGGTFFKLPAGQHQPTIINSFFSDEGENGGGLVADQSGDIFGSTISGGTDGVGRVFELPNGGSFFNLYFFQQANEPTLGVTPSGPFALGNFSDNGVPGVNLFGVTLSIGPNGGGGIYQLTEDQGLTIQPIVGFPAVNGNPGSGLILDNQSNLFGVATSGGTNGDGSIFEAPAGGGVLLTLASFTGLNGLDPIGLLTLDPVSGALYGTTKQGGAANDGTIFKFSNGTITTLASFNTANSLLPNGSLLRDSNGNLFGTTPFGGTNDAGTVFELPLGGKNIITLASFDGANFGSNPVGGLVTDGHGNLFGATANGGVNFDGVIYELSPNSVPFLAFAQPPSHTIATTAGAKLASPVIIDLLNGQSNLDTTTRPTKITLTTTDPKGKTFHFTALSKLGVATFKTLNFKIAGTYTLQAVGGTFAAATSDSFTITPAAPQKMLFTLPPPATTAAAVFTVQAEFEDRFGNLTTNDASAVTASLLGGPKTALLAGTTSVLTSDGFVTFSNLSINLPFKQYRLKLLDGKLHLISKPFAVS